MRFLNAKKVWLAALATLMAAGLSASAARAQDTKALLDAGKNADEWLTTGHGYMDQRYSQLDQINASNASKLGLAWYYDTDSDRGTVESTPLVSNGVMYATLPWSVVVAIDAATGKEKWRWDPKIPHMNFPVGSAGKPDKQRIGPSVCCGPANRGVALYDGKVIVGTLDDHLVALDQQTGKVVWDTQTISDAQDYSITGAPRIAGGKVIVGNAGGEYGVRGFVAAYDGETGKELWRFYTVPGDPTKPFENTAMEKAAPTWEGDWWKVGGGGNVWDGISYDPELNMVYIGIGQGGPWVQGFRSPVGMENLYLCSIVALNADTGKFQWYFQTTPADEWDYDATQGMVLADIKINGKLRHVIMQAPKNGYFYVLDRKTGQFISGAPYVRVTWSTGLDPKTGRPHEAPNMRYEDAPKDVSPGPAGGHAWEAMSYNPKTGLVYLPALDSTFHYMSQKVYRPELGVYNWGIVLGPPDPKHPLPPNDAFLTAWDPVTEKQVWRADKIGGGGTVTTAGNLVFGASETGDFVALSADKGEKLWSAKLMAGFANPVTYEVDGKQYVAVLSGRGGKARIYAFALDANMPIPARPSGVSDNPFGPPPPPPPPAPQAPTHENQPQN
ncbi:MAG TPA: PQQ-dependent dehydrogenase, methanol/ethanol family [Candidatus Acidoferrales bacterium]|jgi:PQQ-dependent dehydrogenase (methanol/ethanol family)|nr:PQQ-dependent dehydrogenase, methanol/ethanol family [Candidatus Acidoferrales bacterium]